MICAALLLAIVALSGWAARLDLCNAKLTSALELERTHAAADRARWRPYEDPECGGIRVQAGRRDFVATLQAAVHLYESYTPRDE